MFVVIKFNLQPETHSDEFISQSLIGNYASEVFNVLKVRVFFQIFFRFTRKDSFNSSLLLGGPVHLVVGGVH